MDFKRAGNLIYQIGRTKNELGGSHWELVHSRDQWSRETEPARPMVAATHVPQVDLPLAKRTFAAVHQAIDAGLVRACHDPSEGGLAVALAEMAFAGGLGARVRLADAPRDGSIDPRAADADTALLFAESASRFLAEVEPANQAAFEAAFRRHAVPAAHVGEVTDSGQLEVASVAGGLAINIGVSVLKEAWQKPLRW
jgi:phosphoribosylformylglycinamidine synthase